MKKKLLILLFTFVSTIVLAEGSMNIPKHHLPDGTYSNTSGKANERNFSEIIKWSLERELLETDQF